MGNQTSREPRSTTPTSNPQSPSSVTASHGPAHHERASHHVPHHHHAARRRESIQALSTAKAQAAPPEPTLDNAESHPTATRPLSRQGRAQPLPAGTSTTAVVAHHLRAHDGFRSPPSDAMGNEQSSQKAQREREKAHLPRDRTQPQPRPVASTPEPAQQQQQHAPSPQTRPVAVPAVLREEASADGFASIDPASASQDYIPAAHFNRPPRLPLPIEEEVQTPGSPIISPQDLSSPIYHGEIEGALPKRSSMLSTTTADDDDLGDEFKPNTSGPTVSTLIEWEGPGERVYVTGTFAGWNRKYKLHRK